MNVRVTRELVEGRYQVSFQVDGFTPAEIKKMSQFGVPPISLLNFQNGTNVRMAANINQIPRLIAAFSDEASATKYQDDVLASLKLSIEGLRAKEDKFTSVQEISL